MRKIVTNKVTSKPINKVTSKHVAVVIGAVCASLLINPMQTLAYDVDMTEECICVDDCPCACCTSSVWANLPEEFQKRIYNATDTYTMYSTSDTGGVYREPNMDEEPLDHLLMNTTVEAVAEYDGWTCITTQDGIAFVRTEVLSEVPVTIRYLGDFTITHYCCEPYKHICGTGTGLTASGIPVRPGMIAVDPRVIPIGSTIMIDGVIYTAYDTGSRVKGNRID